ncbi:MAG: 23S rRNA (uracil(1939)-C(5))-methyltransferase RlmD [Caldilineaceae bacterium]
MENGQRITLELIDMAPGGEAIGRHEGLVVFVPFGLPGEQVEVEITEQKRNFMRGRIVHVLQAASARVQPLCKYFGVCGGCEWQQVAYAAQVQFKTKIVCEQLTRIGKLNAPNVLPCIPSPTAYGYRNHARLARSTQGKPGYRASGSHDVIEVDDCPILEEAVNVQLRQIAGQEVKLASAELDLSTTSPTIQVGDFTYQVSPDAFFQVNTQVASLLVMEVLRALSLGGKERVLDLYCGVGLFTLPMAVQAKTVIGVEANPIATEDARRNAAAFPQVKIITDTVENALKRREIRQQRWDAVVVDPPRAGVERKALASIVALHPPKLVYVSCDPATLARDAKVLCDSGYVLQVAQPLDMFPQTHHVETVVVFLMSEGR